MYERVKGVFTSLILAEEFVDRAVAEDNRHDAYDFNIEEWELDADL
jgi:hypothetical protein